MSKNINKMSIKQIEKVLNNRREQQISELEKEKAQIDKKIEGITQFIYETSPTLSTVKKGSKRTTVSKTALLAKKPRQMKKASMKKIRSADGKSLRTRLLEIGADGQVRSIKDFITALQQSGNWQTSSDDPYSVVAAALGAKNNGFNRVEKGKYQVINNA